MLKAAGLTISMASGGNADRDEFCSKISESKLTIGRVESVVVGACVGACVFGSNTSVW